MISAQQRAQAAFTMALSEHGESINTGAWSRLSRPPAMVRSALEGLLRSLPKTAPEGCQAANARLDRLSDDLAQHLEKIGADLSKAKSSADAQRSNNTANDVLPDLQECLAAGLARGTQGTDDALTIMAWCDWLTQLDLALQETGPALESVAAASAPRAWLHWSTPGR